MEKINNRKLSDSFMENLETGFLSELRKRVRDDDTLHLAIRENYINIYYRGGNILKLSEKNAGAFYSAEFNENYNKTNIEIPKLPKKIENINDIKQWLNSLQDLKGIMDFHFSQTMKSEREFQQLVVRENNFSKVSNGSEYFITDIEFAHKGVQGRFDMFGLQWRTSDKKAKKVQFSPCIIEMKYGDGAINGESGIKKHLEDIENFLLKYDFREILANQFNQLDKLELLKYNKPKNMQTIEVDDIYEKAEVIFIFANTNPRAESLKKALYELKECSDSEHYSLKFYVSNFAGYGLYERTMYSYTEFLNLLDAMKTRILL